MFTSLSSIPTCVSSQQQFLRQYSYVSQREMSHWCALKGQTLFVFLAVLFPPVCVCVWCFMCMQVCGNIPCCPHLYPVSLLCGCERFVCPLSPFSISLFPLSAKRQTPPSEVKCMLTLSILFKCKLNVIWSSLLIFL